MTERLHLTGFWAWLRFAPLTSWEVRERTVHGGSARRAPWWCATVALLG
ncbi:hypothetical protein [Streptomyces roseifaciens]|nr:hypothetical protein [Streptomyces roseifaciens]